MTATYTEIALTTEDEIVAAERRGYERALRQVVEHESNIGADWDGLSEEVEILLRVAAGDRFIADREREQLEEDVEMELKRALRPFFERVTRHLADLLEGEEYPGQAVNRIEQECRKYSLYVNQLLERLHPITPLQKFELFKKPVPQFSKPLADDLFRLRILAVSTPASDALDRIQALLIKLNSFSELKY